MVKWINTGCHEASRRRWRTGSEKLKETCSWYGALACQLACDPLSDWRCSSPAAYGEVWLWNRFCWNLLTACSSALNLCLYICTLVGGWFIKYFFLFYMIFHKRGDFIFHACPVVVLHVGDHYIVNHTAYYDPHLHISDLFQIWGHGTIAVQKSFFRVEGYKSGAKITF